VWAAAVVVVVVVCGLCTLADTARMRAETRFWKRMQGAQRAASGNLTNE
jgi:hypothetical protein